MIHANKKMIQFFSTLADETRLKILISLTEGPKNVNKIHSEIGKEAMTLSAVSHQLRQMNDIDILSFERRGREKVFQLSDNFCWCILQDSFRHFHNGANCPVCKKAKKEGMMKV